MTRGDDPDGVLAWMEEKAAQVTGIPVAHGEVRPVSSPPCPEDLGLARPLGRGPHRFGHARRTRQGAHA